MVVSLFSTSAGAVPEQESRDFLIRRVRLAFGLGLAVATALLAVGEVHGFLTGSPAPAMGERVAYAAFLGIFLLGLLALLSGTPTADRARWVALAVTSGLLLILAIDGQLHPPDYPPLAIISLVLFGAAALIPWSLPFQISLVTASLLAVPAASALTGNWGGSPGWWSWSAAHPDPAAGAAFGAVGVLLLGAVSAVVSWTLYDLRNRARVAERLGGYRLTRELGAGGAGAVYLAEHSRMCRPSAVKIVRSSPGTDPSVVERFEREIEVASRLDHPNTIEIRDYGRADDATFFYAMEYLPGLDLRELVKRHGPVPASRAVYILIQVCESLAEAHGKGIVHRDVKPANVFMTRRGGMFDFVKVLDFGLAKEVRSTDRRTITAAGSIVGTPHFMAPEAVDGPGHYGPPGDLYCLGCTAYWILSGRPPFEGNSAPELMAAHLRREADPLETVSEVEVPRELTDAVVRCMRKAPDERFGSATDLRRCLAEIRFDEPWTQARAKAWWELHLPDTI